jgi:hypothetical protein
MSLAQQPAAMPRRPRVFLSYSHADPDESVVRALADALGQSYDIFFDQMITPSEIWAKRIEREVRASDWLIVLLSKCSCESEMVLGEIELARDEASRSGGRPRILPVRVAFDSPLPYPLGPYLNQIQHACWDRKTGMGGLMEQVLATLSGVRSPGADVHSAPGRESAGRPLPSAPLRPPGGTADASDPFYIERRSERTAVRLISMRGQTIIIKGPRQTGKSSLLNRLASRAMESGKRLALLDLQLFDQATRNDPNLFFRQFGRAIADALELSPPEEPGGQAGAYILNCTSFVDRLVLQVLDTPVLLAIDEADRVFGSPFQMDFFAMLRSWHNLRAHPGKRDRWGRLDLALVSATEPYMFIDSETQSPFNVGEVLRLEDFSLEQLGILCEMHGHLSSPGDVERLYEFFGGHPYLTRRALYEVAQGEGNTTLDFLFAQALDDRGPLRDHLRHYCLGLERYPKLAEAFFHILQDGSCEDDTVFYRLEGAGLVKRDRGRVVPRCLLYARYFHTHLRLR